MDQVSVLRLDLLGGRAPGNKAFKLRHNLEIVRQTGVRRIVSFGGAWSNHLHALAAAGEELGLETVGLVRGEASEADTPTLVDARAWGMRIERISRDEYRRRNDPGYLADVESRFRPCLVIPEGGANTASLQGCTEIGRLVQPHCRGATTVVLPVGTGSTLAGLAAALAPPAEVLGVSALKGATDLEQRVRGLLAASGLGAAVPWSIDHGYHCGGFARCTAQLRNFILEFERVQGIPLEPVYTGKMMCAIHDLIGRGHWQPGEKVLAIHTGGLQGRRGYAWAAA